MLSELCILEAMEKQGVTLVTSANVFPGHSRFSNHAE